MSRHTTKQVDRLLSNQGIVVWDLFSSWVAEVVGQREQALIAMDWTDFDADDQTTLALSLVTGRGRAMPLLWITVFKSELKDKRNHYEDLCLAGLFIALYIPLYERLTVGSLSTTNAFAAGRRLPTAGWSLSRTRRLARCIPRASPART